MGRPKKPGIRMSDAERQRLYRARRNADVDRRQEYLQKEREKWRKDIETGKKVRQRDRSAKEQRAQRKKWREAHERSKGRRDSAGAAQGLNTSLPGTSRQFEAGKKIRRANKTRLTNHIKKLTSKLESTEKQLEKYRKRLQRFGNANRNVSPRSKVNRLVRHLSTENLRRTLLFHTVVINEVQSKYAQSKSKKNKQVIARIVSSKILKKYKLQKMAQEAFGFSRRRWKSLCQGNVCDYQRRKPKGVGDIIRSAVRSFLERDDVSKMTTGKKQTVTRKKKKMQKRLLVDTMKNLHLKFLAESPNLRLSYSLFCSLRPYWVVSPTLADRETCMCKQHENLAFMAKKLYQLDVIDTSDLESLTVRMACDTSRKECMYGECEGCGERAYPVSSSYNATASVSCLQWVTEDQEHRNDPGTTSKVTLKKECLWSQEELLEKFNASLRTFKRHTFNIQQQFSFSRALKQNLPASECVVHIDFAENYSCKHNSEVQAVHWGASHQQAVLHTGVCYVGGEEAPFSFCSVSPSRLKGPPAIWQHLEPVLSLIREKWPNVSKVHFLSDGPCTQYKQRGNLFLFSTEIFKKGFQMGTWNYFEASHGKGAPDGVGGTLKRRADRLVSHGADIPSAVSLFQALSQEESKVKLFYITEESVDNAVSNMPSALPGIPAIMKIHQVIVPSPGKLLCRDVSCICSATGKFDCECQETKVFTFDLTHHTQGPPRVPEGSQWRGPDVLGKWCALVYDELIYPGIIQEVNETHCRVKCMRRVGRNRYLWPSKEDVHWYPFEDVICVIPPPKDVTTRHKAIDREVWDALAGRESEM